jgi:hypothetical protein
MLDQREGKGIGYDLVNFKSLCKSGGNSIFTRTICLTKKSQTFDIMFKYTVSAKQIDFTNLSSQTMEIQC